MFTFQEKQNPLAMLLGNTGSGIVQGALEKRQQEKESNEVMRGLSSLGEEESPLGVYKAIAMLNLPSEKKEQLFKHYNDFSKRQSDLEKSQKDQSKKKEDFNRAVSQGMPEELAEAYANGSDRERGAITDYWLKQQERNIPESESVEPENDVLSAMDQEGNPLVGELPKPSKPGLKLTPTEEVRRQENRYRIQTPIYEKLVEAQKGSEEEGSRLAILDDINESGELPKGLERLNINWSSGDILVPALANPATQRFVKTIADFLSGAKAIFGSRVTNFDLESFKKRIPSLANSEAGRSLIIGQMKILNEAARDQQQALIDSFDKYGGVRYVDYDKVKREAEKKMKPKMEEYKKRLKTVDNRMKRYDETLIHDLKKNLKSGYTLMLNPEGEYTQINSLQVKDAKKVGYKEL